MSRARHYTPSEVAAHNTSSDCWVSFLGKVYNLTPLCEEHAGSVLLKPIVTHSGKDISHWFDPKTKDIKMHIDPITCCVAPYTPMGRFVHIPPNCPRSDWSNNFGVPWWKNETYNIGILTDKTRKITLINTLTLQEQTIEVCSEETLKEILNRYLPYNTHAASYTWKFNGKNLDMTKTLKQNGINDESKAFYELNMDEDEFLPAIHLYFNDDLTEF